MKHLKNNNTDQIPPLQSVVDIKPNQDLERQKMIEVIVNSDYEERFYEAKVKELEQSIHLKQIFNRFINRLFNLSLFGLFLSILFIFFHQEGLQLWI